MDTNYIIQHLVYPNPFVLIGLFILIFIDLLTGVNKAKRNGEATTSRGLRKSYDKGSTYFSLLLSVIVLCNIISFADIKQEYAVLTILSVNLLILGCVYIEVKSILENLIEINTRDGEPNDLASSILIPLHNAIILKLKRIKKQI